MYYNPAPLVRVSSIVHGYEYIEQSLFTLPSLCHDDGRIQLKCQQKFSDHKLVSENHACMEDCIVKAGHCPVVICIGQTYRDQVAWARSAWFYYIPYNCQLFT